MIECENLIIVIENKIYSDVNNPFKAYHLKAKKINNNAEIVEILLSLKEESNESDNEKGYNFVNITYKELLEKVNDNQSSYSICKTNKWCFFMNDFIENINNLQEENKMTIDNDWQIFLNTNNNDINKFLEKFNEDIETKKEQFKSSSERIKQKLEDKVIDKDIGRYGFSGNSNYFSFYMNHKFNDFDMALEVYSMKKSESDKQFGQYYIEIWNRNHSKNEEWIGSPLGKKLINALES